MAKSKLKKWTHVKTRTITKNPYMHVEEDLVKLPNGKIKKYYLSNRGRTAVAIIAIDSKKRILLQKEYRYPVDRVVYEFPGGLVEPQETALKGAQREFREETGYRAKQWKKLGSFYASPSRTDLSHHVYVVKDIRYVGDNPDEAEYLEHEWASATQLRKMVKNGTIKGQTMLACILLYNEFSS